MPPRKATALSKDATVVIEELDNDAPDISGMVMESAEKMLKKARGKKRSRAAVADAEIASTPVKKKAREARLAELRDVVIANPQLIAVLKDDDMDLGWIKELSDESLEQRVMRARALLDGKLDNAASGEVIGGLAAGVEWLAGPCMRGFEEEMSDVLIRDATTMVLSNRVWSKVPAPMKLGGIVARRAMRVYNRNRPPAGL